MSGHPHPAALALMTLMVFPAGRAETIVEDARDIPVADSADVLIIGGSTGAVSAAVAAAEDGADVVLVAPRTYVGDDMAATLQLWLEPGETPRLPLTEALYSQARTTLPLDADERVLEATYEADLPSAGVHRDTTPPRLLSDGAWSTAAGESVQYNGDVSVVLTLKETAPVRRALVMLYHNKDYQTARIAVATSTDGATWEPLETLENPHPPAGDDHVPALVLSIDVQRTVRFVRFSFTRAKGSGRVLLGELVLVGAGTQPAAPTRTLVTPLHVKKTLEQALVEAGVTFLFGSLPTHVVRERSGAVSGVVVANRAGRQAFLGKTIVDATDDALVARLAGASLRPAEQDLVTCKRVVIGGEPRHHEGMSTEQIEPGFHSGSAQYNVYQYTFREPAPGDSYAACMQLEHRARDLTFHADQEFASDSLWWVRPRCIIGRESQGTVPADVDDLPLGVFQPRAVPRLLVLSSMVDVSRDTAAMLMRPVNLMRAGARVGRNAAAQARGLSAPAGAHVVTEPAASAATLVVGEHLAGLRGTGATRTIPQAAASVPVIAEVDVVVVGGGTGGAPAAIAAARAGAETLVLEHLHGLGGVGTLGAISKYYWGNRVGFTKEVPGGASWAIEARAEWWRRTAREAGAEVWFGVLGGGAVRDGDRVVGVVVVPPYGRAMVRANTVIDATGNSDIAAAAGAECMTTDADDIAVQGTGLPPRTLGRHYTNTDFTIVDDGDMLDVWRVFVQARAKSGGNVFDVGQLIDTRERRRIVGEVVLTIRDQVSGRTFADTVVTTWSNFDTHGYTTDPFFLLRPPHKKGIKTHIPYRALLPTGLDGILVIGLGISAHRDAVPLIRRQPDIQNGGYAAGLAAAMAAAGGTSVRRVDVKALQRDLVRIGNLDPEVLEFEDTSPGDAARVAQAAATLTDDFRGAATLLAAPEAAVPVLRSRYRAAASEEERLAYAKTLAVLGDNAGVEDLVRAVEQYPSWDEGWNFRAGGQFGANMSRLDTLIVALGRSGDAAALPAILAKARVLTSESAFSHMRAVALALEAIGDPRAADVLADLLALPGVAGHAMSTPEDVLNDANLGGGFGGLHTRRTALREITLARALYRCGDKDGVGRRILEAYANDLRGHWARHARAVLERR